jgi:hypothetical protein
MTSENFLSEFKKLHDKYFPNIPMNRDDVSRMYYYDQHYQQLEAFSKWQLNQSLITYQ